MKILTEADVFAVRREGQHIFISVNHALLGELGALLPRRLSTRRLRRGSASKSRNRETHA